MRNEAIPPEVYRQRYFTRFDPDLYDPQVWARAAAGAGMKYVVATAKHHEGFCLFDSRHTDFKATNTPARRDLIRPMMDAFRGEGLRAGLYYSLLDWSHPDYVIDPHIHPLATHPERVRMNATRDQRRYAAYMRAQIEELLTGYGDIDVMWFDFSFPREDGTGKGRNDWESEELLKVVRRLRPGIILDDRLDFPGCGDVVTPEQFQPRGRYRVDGRPVVWEACQTMCWSWGYHSQEGLQDNYRTSAELIRTLIDTVSKDGNLLLNIGPTSRGEIEPNQLRRLEEIGAWMRQRSRAIHGCGVAPEGIATPEDCRLTWNARTRRLYVHLFAWPYKHLHLPGLTQRVEYAQFLHDGSELHQRGLEEWQQKHAQDAGFTADTLSIRLPLQRPDVAVPVIELFLEE
jgi:alpha-L-fucosidase